MRHGFGKSLCMHHEASFIFVIAVRTDTKAGHRFENEFRNGRYFGKGSDYRSK